MTKGIIEISLFGRKGLKAFAERPSSVKEILKNTVATHGEKTALIMDDAELTYRELNDLSNRLIGGLQKRYKISKGDRIAALVGNKLEFAIIVLACIKSGAVLIPISTKFKAQEVSYILSNAKPKVLFCDEDLLPLLPECSNDDYARLYLENVIVVGKNDPDGTNIWSIIAEKHENEEVIIQETDPVFMLYTSGTTGRPKGAILSHIGVVHTVMNFQRTVQSNKDTRTILAIPFYHVSGLVSQFLHMVYSGGSMVILERYQNEKYIQQSYKFKVDCHFSITTVYQMMATSPLLKEYSFDFVKIVGFGGTPTSQSTIEMLKEIFPNASYHNVYGATETTAPVVMSPINAPLSKAASVGKPVETVEIKIIDEDDRILGANEVGELLIKGPMVISGYWNHPDANSTSFVDGFWRSGDVGKIDEDGFVYILDRKKDMINRGGEKIFSVEVENVLNKHPDIVEAAVVAHPDEIYGEKVKAVIVSKTLNDSNITEIQEYCSGYLAKYKVPEIFEFVGELPRNASGKVMKHLLR